MDKSINTTTFTPRQIEIIEAATFIIDNNGIQKLTTKKLAEHLGLSEAALYRHFKSKDEILSAVLSYFLQHMETQITAIIEQNQLSNRIKAIFNFQLNLFVNKPAIVSIIFSEGIFQYHKGLSVKVSEIVELIHYHISTIIKEGQEKKLYHKYINYNTITTIIMGSMRMVVLKWKLSGHKTDLIKDGRNVLNGLLKMIEK